MEFIFQLSDYDDSALDEETVQLLAQRLEASSRRTAPTMWSVIDKLNAYTAKGPGQEKRRIRHRMYGIFLLALGIFALIPGLMEPWTPSLILAGGFAVLWGVWSLCFRERKSFSTPASCRKEAARLLERQRRIDWSLPENRTELRFGSEGLSLLAGEQTKAVPYREMTGIFETERL